MSRSAVGMQCLWLREANPFATTVYNGGQFVLRAVVDGEEQCGAFAPNECSSVDQHDRPHSEVYSTAGHGRHWLQVAMTGGTAT